MPQNKQQICFIYQHFITNIFLEKRSGNVCINAPTKKWTQDFILFSTKLCFVLSLFSIKTELQINLYHSFMDVKRTMYMYMRRVNILLQKCRNCFISSSGQIILSKYNVYKKCYSIMKLFTFVLNLKTPTMSLTSMLNNYIEEDNQRINK